MFSANACSYRRGLSPRIRRLISGRFGENRDVHNFMVYETTAVSVCVYDPNRLASMGLGHWAAYAGVGYTYLNEQVGFEWSAVATPGTTAGVRARSEVLVKYSLL